MISKSWILIIFILVLIAGAIYIYYKVDVEPEKELVNLSISAEFNRKKIKTGYEVIGIKKGNTSTSYELIKVPKGVIEIKNINLEEQSFYENTYEINITEENTRLDMILEKAYLPEIDVEKEEKLVVKVSSKNFEEVDFCLKGSLNYIFLEAEGYEEIRKIENFENYDKCYDGNFNLKNSEEVINISYETLANPNKNDFINISFIDKAKNVKIENIL